MNRNANSRMALAPTVNIPRTKMDRPFNNSFTFDVGQLIPFYCKPVLPGQTSRIITHKVTRTQPLVSAPFQDLYQDTYWFFVPLRLVWNHAKQFFGENDSSTPWIPDVEYSIPQLKLESEGEGEALKLHSLPDYFGLPLNTIAEGESISVSSLPFRAYGLIVREFFQAQTVETPIPVPLDDNTYGFVQSSSDLADETKICRGANPYIVNKFHDYFTSLLPTPIRGSDVLALPDMPVFATKDVKTKDEIMSATGATTEPISMILQDKLNSATYKNYILNISGDASDYDVRAGSVPSQGYGVGHGYPMNLQAFSSTTIEDLRTAFAIQRLLERDNYGTRYREVLANHFGVHSPDASMQVPQYLGGNRKMLNISQVLQTSETGETPLGNVAGYSLTNDSHYDFEFSSTEFGYCIGLTCVRYKHRYSQGIARDWSKKTRLEFFWPEFSHLGNQAVLKKEIFANGSSSDNDVFGYSEYAADYRFSQDMVCGEMRPDVQGGLSSWSFADNYNTHPTLSREWLKEDKTNLDRALAVTSAVANQLWCNIQVQETVTLPMPLYSIPALMSQF